MSLSTETVRAALAQIQDPYTQTDLTTEIRGVGVDAGRVAIEIQLGYPAKGWHASLETMVREKICGLAGVESISISIGTKISAHRVQKELTPLSEVKNII
ncbi:MAG: iron-sulfur cluster assembly protein, partial [Arenimonas sp.]